MWRCPCIDDSKVNFGPLELSILNPHNWIKVDLLFKQHNKVDQNLNFMDQKLIFRFKNLTDMMLQEGGSPQTEQQMSEMIKENLTLSVKKGEIRLANRALLWSADETSNQHHLFFYFRNFFIKFLNCSSLHIFLCNFQTVPSKPYVIKFTLSI